MGGIMLLTAVPPLCLGAAHGVLSATVPLCIDMSPLSTRRIARLFLYYPRLPLIPFSPAPCIHSHLPLIPFSSAPYSILTCHLSHSYLPLIPFSSILYINNEYMSRADAIGRFWPHIG